jgi:hypothetical protein
MKKFLMFICAVTLVFGMVGTASALPITFTDTTTFTATGTSPAEDFDSRGWGDVDKLDGFLDFVSWTHHFEFDPPADEVVSGKVTLFLRDDGDKRREYAFGWGEDGTWGLGEVETGSYAYDVATSSLADGSFSILLGSLWGDFYIDRSDLEITYDASAPAPVPEPSTILLMGTGILGLVAYGRKRYNKKA